MFGKKKSNGPKNFDLCSNKRIKPTEFEGKIVKTELECPRTKNDKLQITARANTLDFMDPLFAKGIGSWRSTREGKRSIDYPAYYNIAVATEHLRRVAGETACKGCVFACMTPLEVSEERGRIAQERLEIAQRDLAIERAEEGTRQAYAEIEAIRARAAQIAGAPLGSS